MPGSAKEVENAMEEGVQFRWNLLPLALIDKDGKVSGVKVVQTELGEPDEQGRRSPQPVAGSEQIVAGDAVIVAFGFQPSPPEWLENNGVELDERRRIKVTQAGALPFQTTNAKIYAGGDTVRGSDLVVTAIAEGREAAQSILKYLGLDL